jgi:Aconitase family (aconitate hydratase)
LEHPYTAHHNFLHYKRNRNMRFSTFTLLAATTVVGGWDTAVAFVSVVRHPTAASILGSTALNAEASTSAQSPPRTLYDKIWDDHLVDDDGLSCLMYVDRHLVHEVTSPQAFEGLRMARRGVRRPDCTLVTVDHNVPTSDRQQLIDVSTFIQETASRTQVLQLETNVKDFGLKYFSFADERQGIVHIIGPEQGFTLPGCVTVCGDSHTATHGAFGALAFGIGTSEVEHVLATQVRLQWRKNSNLSMARVFVFMDKLGTLFHIVSSC